MTKVNNIAATTSQNVNATGTVKGKSVENTLLVFLFIVGLLGTMYFFKQAKGETHSGPVYYSSHEQDGETGAVYVVEKEQQLEVSAVEQ